MYPLVFAYSCLAVDMGKGGDLHVKGYIEALTCQDIMIHGTVCFSICDTVRGMFLELRKAVSLSAGRCNSVTIGFLSLSCYSTPDHDIVRLQRTEIYKHAW